MYIPTFSIKKALQNIPKLEFFGMKKHLATLRPLGNSESVKE
jgi:hypothetical protein